MKKKLKENLNVLISLTISILFLSLGIIFHNGYKEGYYNYFALAILIAPFLVVGLSQKKYYNDFVKVLLLILLYLILATAFWDYKDKPWFSPPDDWSCEGPCYGWFSFENDLEYLPLIYTGLVSTLLGVVTKFLRQILKKKIG